MKGETISLVAIGFLYAIFAGAGFSNDKENWGVWLIASVVCVFGIAYAGYRRG